LEHRDRFLVYAEYFVGQEQALDLLDVRHGSIAQSSTVLPWQQFPFACPNAL
jgi:hypothetical protein